MTICLIASTYVTPTIGGIEGVTYRLREIFKRCGHNVYLVVADSPCPGDEICPFNIILPSGNACNSTNKDFMLLLVKKHHIDVIINNSIYFNIIQLVAGIRKLTDIKVLSCIHCDPQCFKISVYDDLAHDLFNRNNDYPQKTHHIRKSITFAS